MPGWSKVWQCQQCHLKLSCSIFSPGPPDIGDDECVWGGPPPALRPAKPGHDWQPLTRENAKTRLDRWGRTTVGEFCSAVVDRLVQAGGWMLHPFRPWLTRRRERRESTAAAADLLVR